MDETFSSSRSDFVDVEDGWYGIDIAGEEYGPFDTKSEMEEWFQTWGDGLKESRYIEGCLVRQRFIKMGNSAKVTLMMMMGGVR